MTDTPTQYRKRPVVIEAIKWTGKNLRDVICFTDGPLNTRTHHAGMMWEQYSELVAREGLKIFTLEGKMNADVGDFIIRGVKGEFYPCKPDIFAATYENADTPTPLAADRIEALVKERDEATNQLDSARHSVDVLEKRVEALVKERDQWIVRCGRERAFASSHRIRAERLEAAGRAYREATRHLKPCPETSAGFDAALKGDKP